MSNAVTMSHRAIVRVIGWMAAFLMILCGGIAAYSGWKLSSYQDAIRQARQQRPLVCLGDTTNVSKPWQKMGTIVYCEPVISGKFQRWSESRLVVEGEYKNGVEQGRWVWYDAKGNPERIVHYDSGRQVSQEKLPH